MYIAWRAKSGWRRSGPTIWLEAVAKAEGIEAS